MPGDPEKILSLLREATRTFTPPMTELIVDKYGRDPFLVLISCLLSLRARDVMTFPVSCALFEHAKTPHELAQLPNATIERIIKPIGFYRKKAQIIRHVAQYLIDHYAGTVPHTDEELRAIPGIGPKTAALVLSEGFSIPALCVDVHVHRIANRLGIVQTTHPEETEAALQQLIPRHEWRDVNRLFVMWGQNICTPQSPWCSRCPLAPLCQKVGVTRSR